MDTFLSGRGQGQRAGSRAGVRRVRPRRPRRSLREGGEMSGRCHLGGPAARCARAGRALQNPTTLTGALDGVLVPSPSWPPLPPQHQGPSLARAQVWKAPAEIWVKLLPPSTATGVLRSEELPSP